MSWLTDLLICLRFFSRLPVPETQRELRLGPGGFAQAVAMTPVAGALVGLVPSVTLFAASGLGLPPMLAATLAIASLVAATGALHEDGLADCADGFGGGRTRERKLEIMRDSRIGTFGTCALVLSLLLRTGALASVAASYMGPTFSALVVSAVVSRTLCLWPLVLLNPARTEGVGASSQPASRAVLAALGLAIVILVALGLLSGRLAITIVAAVVAGVAAFGFCGLAHRQIGGQTGDVAGAVQQIAETAVLLVFAAASGASEM